MTEDDSKIYPRLQMLSEFDGEIEGRLKYHKSLYQYRQQESDTSEWAFRREEHGPLDPGFSSRMQSFEDMELVDVEEDREPHRFTITHKGKRFAKGIQSGLSKLENSFDTKRERISEIARRNKNRSGQEIAEDDEIQEAKEDPFQTDV